MKKFLNGYYKPWSVKWVVQRAIMVMKESRLPQLSFRNLLVDYKFSREVWRTLHQQHSFRGSRVSGDLSGLFTAHSITEFEYPKIITCENTAEEHLSGLNRYFDHIYVVNLPRRADRRLEMIQKLNRYNVRAEFFRAEDGTTEENIREFNEYYHRPIDPGQAHEMELRLKRKVIYSPGAWATLKTYRNLLEDARSRGFKKILCLQDDAVFCHDFERLFADTAALIPSNWKILYLGASQHAWEEGADLFRAREDITESASVTYYHPLNTDGAFAIGLDQGVFAHLLGEIAKMNCSFDSGPLRSATKAFRGDCYVIQPNLIIADVRESDIRISRKQREFARTVRWDLEKYDFPFQKDRVSVIIPAYNAEKTIEKSIRSLLRQTYRELEIIVVDDCSTDRTTEVVENLAREDARVKLIRQATNTGCYGARNTGLRASLGSLIAFQDADDFSLPGRIEAQILPLCLGRAQFTMARIARTERKPEEFDIADPEAMMALIAGDYASASTAGENDRVFQKVGYISTVMKRSVPEKLGLFWENRFGSDAEYVERILYHNTGLTLPKSMYVQKYLAEIQSIDHVFHRIDAILMICLVTGGENLSVKFKQKARLEFQELYRNRLKGQYAYEYPKLDALGK